MGIGTDDGEPVVGMIAAEDGGGPDETLKVLLGVETADPPDDANFGVNSPLRPNSLAAGFVARKAEKIDAVGYDDRAVGGKTTLKSRGATGMTIRNDQIGIPSQCALDPGVESRETIVSGDVDIGGTDTPNERARWNGLVRTSRALAKPR